MGAKESPDEARCNSSSVISVEQRTKKYVLSYSITSSKFTQLIQWMTPLDGDYIEKNILGARRYGISLRTGERSEQVRCRVEHEKRNFISASNDVLFCLSYKHNNPVLTRKVNFINE